MIVLALISYAIGFLFLLRIRNYDKYDKEPLGRLLWFSFIGGIVSVATASFIYLFIHPKLNFVDAILVGAVEEFAKFFTLMVLFGIIKKEFDEIVDGLIYIAAIALGFSVIENIFYALEARHAYTILAQRFIFATIGHISFSVYMGTAYFIHKKIKKNYIGLILAFVISTLAHGLYDGFIFDPSLNIFFFPIYFFLIYLQFRLLKTVLALSTHKKKFDLSNFEKISTEDNIHCCHCNGVLSEKQHFLHIELHVCKTCNHLIIPQNNFGKMLKYYRPILNKKSFFKIQRNKIGEILYINDNQLFKYNVPKQKFNVEINTLRHWFTQQNEKDLDRYLNRSAIGYAFKYIGLKHFDFQTRNAYKKNRKKPVD